jgi:hypothetical protein
MGRRLQLLARASTFRGPQQQPEKRTWAWAWALGCSSNDPTLVDHRKRLHLRSLGSVAWRQARTVSGCRSKVTGTRQQNQTHSQRSLTLVAVSDRFKIIPAVRFLHQLGLWRQRHDRFVGMGHAGRWDDGSAPGLDAANLALMFRSTPVIAVGLGRPRSYSLTVGIQALDELRMLYSGG